MIRAIAHVLSSVSVSESPTPGRAGNEPLHEACNKYDRRVIRLTNVLCVPSLDFATEYTCAGLQTRSTLGRFHSCACTGPRSGFLRKNNFVKHGGDAR